MSGLILIGAGPGIGRSVARRFAKESVPVALVARTEATLSSVALDLATFGVPVSLHQADAASTEDLKRVAREAITEHGVPDAVVYNAGVIQADAPGDLTAEQQAEAWSVNVLGALTTAIATMPLMAARGSGSFLSTGGMATPEASYLSLSLGKAGLRTLTTMLAQFYGPQGVHAATVTVGGAVQPGTRFDPDRIAEHYWRLHNETRGQWTTEYVFDGAE